MPGNNGDMVSKVITDSYDVLYGNWPENYNEVVLVLDKNNAISTSALYQLGLITQDEYQTIEEQIANDETVDVPNWNYDELVDKTFYLVPNCDCYADNGDGTYKYIGDDLTAQSKLIDNSIGLKVVGVIRPIEDAANATLTSAVAYTDALTEYVINHTNDSAIVQAQEATPDINVLNGLPFVADNDETKIENAKQYISNLNISDKASLYTMILYNQTSAETTDSSSMPTGAGSSMLGGTMDETTLATAMDMWVENHPDSDVLLSIYNQYVKGNTYDDNLSDFGKVSYDAPDSISIYADSFEDKDAISQSITNYNQTVNEDEQITYTDFVAILTSSITSIVNVITYVLIAFVAVSLIVSCIMIGIITHISVMERTKEIGILRAIGASKKNISQVFNAETIIIGFCAGLLGVGISESV